MIKGDIRKLESKHDTPVSYWLELGGDKIPLNELIDKEIKLSHTGKIHCIETGKEIKKSYGQGYSWEQFITLAQCDTCIVKPELCHYANGTCREPEWGEAHCMQPHIIYLANTGSVKIGITRKKNIPTRWIDQGASFALPIMEVKDRRTSGLIEVEIAKVMGDKTNWRKMLKNELDDVDLMATKDKVLNEFKDLIKKFDAKVLDEEIRSFEYPNMKFPEKVSSLSLDKKPIIESKLIAIKGQYLIFECGALNMRKHQGYEITLEH